MPLDTGDEITGARFTDFHWRLASLVALITLYDGYDTFNPAYVIHFVADPWGLRAGEAGLLVSSGLAGFLIGATAHGPIADRYGRRRTILGGMWIASIFTLLTPLIAGGLWSFSLVRLLTGIGLGTLLPLATTYVVEFAPSKVANRFALWSAALGWAAGGTLAGVVGIFVTPYFGWQSLYWVGATSFLLLAVLHWKLPESPRFLALHGRNDEIRDLLIRLRPEKADTYRSAKFEASRQVQGGGSLLALLSPRYRRTSLLIWMAAFLSLFCVYGLSGWIPTIMLQRGASFAASFGFGAIMQVMSFVGGLTCAFLADRYGAPAKWLAVFYGLGGVAVLFLAAFNAQLTNMAGIAAAGFLIIGAQFMLNTFTAATYETKVRASAVGMELGIGRIGAILGPLVAGVLQDRFAGPGPMFVTIAGAAMLAGVAMATLWLAGPAAITSQVRVVRT